MRPPPVESSKMSIGKAPGQIIRVLADGTGVTPGEIELQLTAAAVMSAVFGLLRAVVPLMDALPSPASRPESVGALS
jgi:hypothetical protein